jgi:hypothetical protein
MAQYYPPRLSIPQMSRELQAEGIDVHMRDLKEEQRSVAFPAQAYLDMLAH